MERTFSRLAGDAVEEAQHVVVESILLVPHAFRPGLIESPCNPKEMVSVFSGHVFVHRVVGRRTGGDL